MNSLRSCGSGETRIGRRADGAAARRRAFSSALKATRDVIVDLSELQFADASLMIDLAVLAQRLRAQGRTLWLSGAQPNVQTLIETMGLHRLPAVRVDSAKTAIAS
jgi:anti-anti-sigma regulatory factor